jgi:hypothetical protein
MDSALGLKIQRDLDAYILELKRKYGEHIIQIIAPFKERIAVTDQNGTVIEQNGGLKLMELVRLWNAADVALISTFFDGLNLAPFELTASQGNSVPCALIISEFMGCSRSLNGVLRVNPWSLEAISDALHSALSMSTDERRANHSRRYNYVMNHTVSLKATQARMTLITHSLSYLPLLILLPRSSVGQPVSSINSRRRPSWARS